jgi:hypothetical protein
MKGQRRRRIGIPESGCGHVAGVGVAPAKLTCPAVSDTGIDSPHRRAHHLWPRAERAGALWIFYTSTKVRPGVQQNALKFPQKANEGDWCTWICMQCLKISAETSLCPCPNSEWISTVPTEFRSCLRTIVCCKIAWGGKRPTFQRTNRSVFAACVSCFCKFISGWWARMDQTDDDLFVTCLWWRGARFLDQHVKFRGESERNSDFRLTDRVGSS